MDKKDRPKILQQIPDDDYRYMLMRLDKARKENPESPDHDLLMMLWYMHWVGPRPWQ